MWVGRCSRVGGERIREGTGLRIGNWDFDFR